MNDTTAGYAFLVAASWLPVHNDPLRWRDGAGNAARVLRGVVADRAGAWIGCTATSLDEATLLDNVWLHPVALDGQTAEDYLDGHCHRTLSPLYHDNGPAPMFEPLWRDAYRRVNAQVATRVADAAVPGATVWVHDYHLQLVPGLLRALRPDLRIGFFLHSPFPAVERFLTQPMRDDILDSLVAADLVAFQSHRSADNFLGTLEGRRTATVEVLPSSVDTTTIDAVARLPEVHRAAAAIRADLGDPRTVLLSIGAPEHADASHRLLDTYARLLAERRIDPETTTLVHVAMCGDDATHLRCDRERTDRTIASINGTFGRVGRPAVGYVHREQTLPDIVALYLATDVMLALPLRDGMGLAAKEYLAARTDDTGQLILSEFSGSATDLTGARLVNPYDTEAVADAITEALRSTRRACDIAAMRQMLHTRDATAWAYGFLDRLDATAARTRAAR